MPQSRELKESHLVQLNLLLPIEAPPTELPEDSRRELSLVLATLLLSAAGLEVSDDNGS
jgi:hypothetical protein